VSVTICHVVAQHHNGNATRNEEATRRHTSVETGDEWAMLLGVLCYFFGFAAGMLMWALGGTRSVHPTQMWQVQLLGSAILMACVVLFVAAHCDMGENWSPEPEQKARHHLVTSGTFRWARHPIYAVFLWAAIGTLLATQNWVIAWCVFGSVMVVLRRIETEERILVGLFGDRYLAYRKQVPALGPPWQCLGFDGDMSTGASISHREYEPIKPPPAVPQVPSR
jgi:protein-S-isoprenylcysteine O-methyltransferase Ste14